MKLSIIIPVFNTEKYVAKCLHSCLNQDFPLSDYEIIVVNDGSSDNSLSIIKDFASRYDNIRIVEQENQGLSMARNNGFDQSKGEYVWFVDSDDYIDENCLGRIGSLLQHELDILQLQYRLVFENGAQSRDADKYIIEGIKSGKEITEQGGLPAPAPFSILRSKFLKDNGFQFVQGIYHEDMEFKPRVTYLAKNIASDKQISYNYLQRESGSIMTSFKSKNGDDLLFVMNSLLNFAEEQNLSNGCLRAFYRIIGLNMNSFLSVYHSLEVDDRNFLFDRLRDNRHLFRCMLKSKSTKYQVEGLCFLLSVRFALMLHRLLR